MLKSLSTSSHYELLTQLVKYTALGLVINGCGFGIYLLLTWVGMEPIVTMSLLYCTAVVINFFGSRNITFKHQGSYTSTAIKYVIAHVGGYLINLCLLMYFHDKLGWPHQWVQGSSTFVVALYLFTIFKLYVFPNSAQASSNQRP